MDSLNFFCIVSLLASDLYWFVCILGPPNKRASAPLTFYSLVTDIYEWGWGQSFHFSPSIPGKSNLDATRLHKEMVVDLINVKPGDRIFGVGCEVDG